MTEPKDSKTQSTKPFATIVEALRGRNATYDMLANVYFMPLTAEQVNGFAAADLSAYENINDELTAGINDMKRYLAKRDSGTRQELAVSNWWTDKVTTFVFFHNFLGQNYLHH